MKVLMTTLVRDIPDNVIAPDDDIIKVKTQAGHLIWQVVERLDSNHPRLRFEIARILLNKLYQRGSITTQGEAPQGMSPAEEGVLILSGFVLFGIIFTLCQLRGDFTKILISCEMRKIVRILNVKLSCYQGNTRQIEAIQRAKLILQETAFVLIRYMRLNETNNELDFLQIVDTCKEVFGPMIEPAIVEVLSFPTVNEDSTTYAK
jgi:hypothetical protein